MDLMEFLLSHDDLSTNGIRDEGEVWDQFGVDIAPLVVDSVGFTRTTQSEGIVHFLTQLAKARSITEQALRQANPVSFVFHADNCFAFFATAEDALIAGMKVRDAINRAALPLTSGENFGVSMGIGFGRLLSAGPKDGYFGDEMNIASKLGEDLGSRDDIFLSEAAHATLLSKDQYGFEQFLGQVSGAEFTYYRLK
jgi:class 3 adenylate cyclase